MNTFKRKLQLSFIIFVFTVVFVPAINAQAEILNKPTGVKLNAQRFGEEFEIIWDFDNDLKSYCDTDLYVGYGYEIRVTNAKNKVLAKYDTDDIYRLIKDHSKCAVSFKMRQLMTKAFKVKIRSYIFDINNQYTYSPVAEKVIVPRPRANIGGVLGKNKVKICWTKISGAKSYTLYLAKKRGSKKVSFKKVATTKKTSAIVGNIKINQQYYVYASANGVKFGKKRYNSTKVADKGSYIQDGFSLYYK
ncbi:MAG: hypothetical protein K2K56_14190 [Lachnospiraceae bacterium]|nr:hypothetical protein [Lachnospiraceae bacterium]